MLLRRHLVRPLLCRTTPLSAVALHRRPLSSSSSSSSPLSYETRIEGKPGTSGFRIFFVQGDAPTRSSTGTAPRLSPWHDIPLVATPLPGDPAAALDGTNVPVLNYVNEIPKNTKAKLEIDTGALYNPIRQDRDKKTQALRYFKYGNIPFNYGALPQTWEDPSFVHPETQCGGDDDPVDVVELSGEPIPVGAVVPIRVLGVLALIDQGETDWKVLGIARDAPGAADVRTVPPEALAALLDWFENYKVAEGKAANEFAFGGQVKDVAYTLGVIRDAHADWKKLRADPARAPGLSV